MQKADFERVGRYIYAFHRAAYPLDDLTGDGRAKPAPAELVARAAQVVQQFDRHLQAFNAITDAEIQASLEEAAAVKTLIDEWRSTSR